MLVVKRLPNFFVVLLTAYSASTAAMEFPYQDPSISAVERTQDLLSRMTLDEKIGQMCQYVGPRHVAKSEGQMSIEEVAKSDSHGFYPGLHSSEIPQLVEQGKIGSFLHVVTRNEANQLQEHASKSRLGIPLLLGIDAIHGNAMIAGSTVYPAPLGMASSWNTGLVRQASAETALEMRFNGLHWTFTPNVDIARDPRWGRIGETFGEDPYLVGKMGVASVQGLQQGSSENQNRVLATVKHFVAGGDPSNGLNFSPMDVSLRSLRQDYFPPFEKTIEAGAYTLMAAHNEINGVPAHANRFLLNDVLRSEWNFKGFVVSDWTDVERLTTLHRVAPNMKEAVYQAVHAGIDMHMHGPNFFEPLKELVQEGRITEDRIDASVHRILYAKFMLGLFDKARVDETSDDSATKFASHGETALELARQSIVLLSNKKHVLPVGRGKKIFVTGPNANNHAILGDWVLEQPSDRVITVVEGLNQLARRWDSHVDFLDIGDQVRAVTAENIAEANKRARAADLSIIVVGENPQRYQKTQKTSGENASRAAIDLFGDQLELIKSIESAGKPTIVVFVSGRPISEPWIVDNSDAVLNAWEPGGAGGQAIAEIIFGEVNPSGKLPITIPYSVGHLRAVYNHKPSTYMRKYVDSPTRNLFEFGYGLSYVDFRYGDVSRSKKTIATDESFEVSVTVTNTGERSGTEIVQLYIRDQFSVVTRPVKELKGFKRIDLGPGQTQTVSFEVSPDMLAYYDLDMNWTVENGAFDIMLGSSSRDRDLQTVTVRVE